MQNITIHIGEYSLCVGESANGGTPVRITDTEKKETLFSFLAKEEHIRDIVGAVKDKSHLIPGPRAINLFESEALEDYILPQWLMYAESSSLGFVLDVGFLDALNKKYGCIKSLSNESILAAMQDHFFLTPDSYLDATLRLDEVRKLGGIEDKKALDLDGFIAEAGKFLLSEIYSVSPGKIPELAFESSNEKIFKRKIAAAAKSLVKTEKIFCLDGFQASVFVEDGELSMQIEYAGICLAYNAFIKSNIPEYKKILLLRGDAFWHDVWYELFGMHRDYLIAKEEEEKAALSEKIAALEAQLKRDCYSSKRGEEMPFSQIAEEYRRRFGQSYSDQTFSSTLKKALGKIRAYLENAGTDIEEYLCA